MSCLLVAGAMFLPRLTLFFIWLLTDWLGRAFDTALWPFLGFLFMPYTTLAYMAAMLRNDHNVNGWWLVLVVIAVLIDLSGQGETARRRRSRRG